MNRFRFSFALGFLFSIFLVVSSSLNAAAPQVKIRVAQYEKPIDFIMPKGGAWFSGTRKGVIQAGKTYRITGKIAEKAVKRFHLMVGSAAADKTEDLQEIENRFSARKTHRFYVGNPPADGMPDNRSVFIGVGIFNDIKEARKLQDQLSAENISSWVFNENIKPARGSLTLTQGGKSILVSNTAIELLARDHVVLKKVEHARGYSWHGFQDRNYAGRVFISWGVDDVIDCVEQLDLEKLIVGIVPSEISAKAMPAALQAQAVAARGEMLSKKGVRHLNEGYDFCSEQHCQVYKGLQTVDKYISENISCTRGLIMKNKEGKILDAVYGANCGGHSAANHMIWTSNPNPHLQGVSDIKTGKIPDLTDEVQVRKHILEPQPCWCAEPGVEGADKFRWQKTLTKEEWKKFEETAAVGKIREIGSFQREISGRIVGLKITGSASEKTVLKELPIRRIFGGLRSSCFIADWQKDKDGNIVGASFSGAGWGHGVGMCQTGAQSMAKAGRDFKTILLHYFPGVNLIRLY